MRKIIVNEADRTEFVRCVMAVELGKKRFIGEIKMYRKQRSPSQNKLYWMWLNCIKDETGNDVDALHSYFKRKFLPWKSVSIFDDEVLQVTSTTELNTKDFYLYMEKIKQDMMSQAIFLPEPGDQGFEQFYVKYND